MLYFVTWILFECLFYCLFLSSRNRLQKINKPKRSLTKEERTRIFYKCLDTIHDLQSWCEGWFYYKHNKSHPTIKEIRRDNLALWFAWAFWHENLDVVQQNKAWTKEIERMLSIAEDKFGIKFSEGYNADLCCIRLDLDPLQAIHRPLVVYLGIYLCTLLFNIFFLQWTWGFNLTASNNGWGGPLALLDGILSSGPSQTNVAYWSKNTKCKNKTPIVFIHGVGAGLMGYLEFIHQLLMQSQDRPVFLIELPYISMHLVEDIPCAEETVKGIRKMLHDFGYSQAVFVSHSMGTGVVSWISGFSPDIIAGSIMIDPICFLLHYHHVAFNFIHRVPKAFIEFPKNYISVILSLATYNGLKQFVLQIS